MGGNSNKVMLAANSTSLSQSGVQIFFFFGEDGTISQTL